MDALSADRFLKRFLEDPKNLPDYLPQGELKVVLPIYGVKTVVRLLEVDGIIRAVVQVYSREQSRLVKQRLLVEEILKRHEINSPRILDVYNGAKSGTILVEEFLQGNHLKAGTVNESQILKLAEVFSDLHAVRSPRFGSLARPSRWGFVRRMRKDALNRCAAILRRRPEGIDRASLRHIRRWFRRFSPRFKGIDAYSLVHGTSNIGNLLWCPDRDAWYLLDFASMGYGHRGKDLAQTCHVSLGGNPDHADLFLNHYFADGRNGSRAEYEVVEPFFHAYFHLARCEINCRRCIRRNLAQGRVGPKISKKGVRHWHKALEVVERHPA